MCRINHSFIRFPLGFSGVVAAVLTIVFAATKGAHAEEPFDPDRLEKLLVVDSCHDPMQLEVLEDGRLLFIERGGAVCYWSNDPLIPPYNRGFLDGRVAQVLLYTRPLSEEELVANEVYLWNSNRSLLDPERLHLSSSDDKQ